MAKPDIYVVCQLFYPELISTGLTLTELCERLSEKGVSIHVFCGYPTITQHHAPVTHCISYRGIQIQRVWSTRFPKLFFLGKLINHITFTLSILWHLLRVPRHSKLLLLTNPPIMPFLMLLLYPIKSFRYSILLFDLYPETLWASKLFSKHHPLIKLWHYLNQRVYRHAQHLITIGRCMQEKILSYLPETQHDRVTYIPIWSDNRTIHHPSPSHSFREQWSLGNSFVVGYSGNMALFHPIETILNAAKQLRDQKDIIFLFVGEGGKKQWAQDFAKTHGLTQCKFYSYVDRDQLGNLLSTFDCGLCGLDAAHTGLSVPSKAMGLLCASVPIIALMQQESEIARIIQEYRCGLVLDPDDSHALAQHILQLHRDRQTGQTFQSNCKKATTAFNLDSISARYYRLLA